MPRPLIGITTNARNERGRFDLSAEYVEAVRRAGGIPVLLPPGEPASAELLERLDGLILSGGGDVDPQLYGGKVEHPEIKGIDPERDATELDYARRLVARGVPALCICRGAQVMNVALGGSLVEHLPDEVGDALEHHRGALDPPHHPVEVEPGSRLAGILETVAPSPVSRHHQAAREVAPGLRPVAWATDGTIEALESPEHPWLLAVQWHPESSAAVDPSQQRLFDDLVRAAARLAPKRAP